MSRTNHPKPAAYPYADHNISALALVWTFQTGNPKWGEKFARLLDERLKQMLPEGRLREILQGQESEIRQRAALMLLDWFLRGNRELQLATEIKDLGEVANQIQRSINAAIRISTMKIRRSLIRDLNRFVEYNEKEHTTSCIHPALRVNVWELPFEAQQSLLLLLLEGAETTRAVSPSQTSMVRRMIDLSMSQADMAKDLGISRPALNQRISHVGSVVRSSLEKTEFPTQAV
jgi:hypothetical protein